MLYWWIVVSVNWNYRNPAKRVGLVQSRRHLINMLLVLAMI